MTIQNDRHPSGSGAYAVDIMRKLNYHEKFKLTILARNVARVRGVSAVKALELIETGEVDLKDVEAYVIKSLQKVQPKVQPKEDKNE